MYKFGTEFKTSEFVCFLFPNLLFRHLFKEEPVREKIVPGAQVWLWNRRWIVVTLVEETEFDLIVNDGAKNIKTERSRICLDTKRPKYAWVIKKSLLFFTLLSLLLHF